LGKIASGVNQGFGLRDCRKGGKNVRKIKRTIYPEELVVMVRHITLSIFADGIAERNRRFMVAL
jgi:hypothetical protein